MTNYIIACIVPLILIIAGFIQTKFPPKKINNFYGYRTIFSKSSQEAWDYANKIAGKIMLASGIILLVLYVIILAAFVDDYEDLPIVLEVTALPITIINMAIVEYLTRKKFKK